MTTITDIGISGLLLLIILSFISGTGLSGNGTVQTQFNRMNCGMPQFQGYPFSAQTYNTRSASNSTLTLTCTTVHTPNGFDYAYGQPTIALGVFFYVQDYLSEMSDKLGAFFYLLGLVLSPANFSILGYTVASIGLTAQIFIYSMYAFCYIGIGGWIYKLVDPFGVD